MEKIKKPIIKPIKNFNIYMEDLEEMLEVLTLAKAESVEIVANDYKFQDISKLLNDKFNNLENLKITSRCPHIIIEYRGYDISLYARENNYENIGICSKLEDIIVKTRNKNMIIIKKFFGLLLPLLSGMYLGYSLSNNFNIISLFIIVVSAFFSFKLNKDKGLIHNSYMKDKTNYWSRNKEKISVSLISAIIGSIFTVLIQKIF